MQAEQLKPVHPPILFRISVLQDFCANKDIYVSSPTWGNHNAIFKRCGLNVQSYRYYKPETRGLDFEAYTEDLNACTDESTVVRSDILVRRSIGRSVGVLGS